MIADRTFDGPPLETAGQSLVQGNAGLDDRLSSEGAEQDGTDGLASSQATRGVESVTSSRSPALPMAASNGSEGALDESSEKNSDPRHLNSVSAANREEIDSSEQADLPVIDEEESDRASSRLQAVPAQEKSEHTQEAPADNEGLDLASSLTITDEQSDSSGLADTVTDTVVSLSSDSAAKDNAPAPGKTSTSTSETVAGTRVSADQVSADQVSAGQEDDLPASQSSGEASEPVAYSAFVRRYINAAIGGNVGAQATLGYFYEVGEHVDADEREAIRWYEKAAENDHLQATLRLAEIQIARGNSAEGVKWYQQAATLGDRDAQAMLGFFYQTGEHVGVDLAQAIKWYLAAADQEQVIAQNNLGRLYQIGDGVDKDIDQAIYWYEKAAKNGSTAARRNLEKLLP